MDRRTDRMTDGKGQKEYLGEEKLRLYVLKVDVVFSVACENNVNIYFDKTWIVNEYVLPPESSLISLNHNSVRK